MATDVRGVVRERHARHSGRWVLGVGLLLTLAVVAGSIQGWVETQSPVETSVIVGAMLYFFVLGSLILARAGGNRIGWVFSYLGLAVALSGILGSLADQGVVVAWPLANALWMSALLTLTLLLLWYPTGRVPGPRWRLVQLLDVGVIGLVVVGSVFMEEICLTSEGGICYTAVPNPMGIAGVPNPEQWWLFGVLGAAAGLSSFAALVWRYRRCSRVERLQVKWFLLGASGLLLALVTEIVYESLTGGEVPGWVSAVAGVSVLVIPVSATLAILRYRLYDIDRIISRTVSYALVVAFLGLVFAAGVVWIPSLLVLGDSPLLVAGSTLVVAGSFNPVRRRVQGWVDRRFNRSRYDAARVMDQFASSLRDRVDPDGVVAGWVGVVSETMHPESIRVWVRER